MEKVNRTLADLGVREPVEPLAARVRPARPAKIVGETKAERRLRRRTERLKVSP